MGGLSNGAPSCVRAAQTSDEAAKLDFQELEARWLRLAESYKFIEQLEVFLTDGKSFREKP